MTRRGASCSACPADRDDHHPCPWCGTALEHLPAAHAAACRAGLARMARARRPEDRTALDRRALEEEPAA